VEGLFLFCIRDDVSKKKFQEKKFHLEKEAKSHSFVFFQQV